MTGAAVYTRAAVTLADLAARLGCTLEGDGAIEIARVNSLDNAGPGDLTFLANSKYAPRVATTRASALICDAAVRAAPCAILRTRQPYLAFATAVALLAPAAPGPAGISPLAAIDPTATLGADVAVGPFAVIGPGARVGARTVIHAHAVIGPGATIGTDCRIHAQVSVREGVEIGNRVVLQDSAVIGSDGFGFARRDDGTHQKIPQSARVVIEDDVEIGSHTAIDRPAIGETRIGAGTKIDNLVQVAHGVKIGKNVLLAAHVGIAGSAVLEDDVVLAGQVGVVNHATIGRGAVVQSKSAVWKDIDAGARVAGIPARDAGEWRESVALIRRLPKLRKAVAELEARLAEIESRLKLL